MDSIKNLCKGVLQFAKDFTCPVSASRTRNFLTLVFTLVLIFFFVFPSDDSFPVISYTSLVSRVRSNSDQVAALSSDASPEAHFGSKSYRRYTGSPSPSPLETSHQVSRSSANSPLMSENSRSSTDSAAVSPVGTIHQISRNSENGRLITDSASVFSTGTSDRDPRNSRAPFNSEIPRKSSGSAALSPVGTRNSASCGYSSDTIASCDIFNGHWVKDENSEPLYQPGSCPFVDDAFNCFKNGRSDSDYLKLKWKPSDCEMLRFDAIKMLNILRGKRMVFVGDSINRNMWESLVCALRESLSDKSRVFEASGRREFRSQGFYSFRFKDFECSIDFIRSPFLVQEWKVTDKDGQQRETLRLDTMQDSCKEYRDADIIIFNTGHWWTHQKMVKGSYYFQEGDHVYDKLEVTEAYKKALRTWAQWVETNINKSRTNVFFRGYSSSHFKGGQWNSGGSCDGETRPITNDTYLAPYPWMTKIQESVLSEMRSHVFYLNITKMTDYRKDGHPSIFRQKAPLRQPGMVQDCSHWCLPGVPDSWNELLYTTMIRSQNFF